MNHIKIHPTPLQLYCIEGKSVLKTVRTVSDIAMCGLIYKIVLELLGRDVNQKPVDSRNFWNTGI
jgi:hypothetical protein